MKRKKEIQQQIENLMVRVEDLNRHIKNGDESPLASLDLISLKHKTLTKIDVLKWVLS